MSTYISDTTRRLPRAWTESPLVPITKPLLADTVHDRLLSNIISGELPAGTKLNIDDIALALGVSRTPIREALVRLSRARLIDIVRNSSTVVARWGVTDMQIRTQLIGGILRTIVDTTNAPKPGTTLQGLDAADPRSFVHIATQLTANTHIDLAVRTIDELAAPLALFLAPDILRAHRVEPTQIDLEPAVASLKAAFRGQDTAAAVLAVDALTNSLNHGLHTKT